jgi:hypothetical protein
MLISIVTLIREISWQFKTINFEVLAKNAFDVKKP